MTKDRLRLLMIWRMSGELAPQETRELAEYMENLPPDSRRFLEASWDDDALEALLHKELPIYASIDPSKGYENWVADRQARKKFRMKRITRLAVAASLLIIVVVGRMIKKLKSDDHPITSIVAAINTVMPGRNTATLTLSNGQEILLDSVHNGDLGLQGGSRLIKADSGSISYLSANNTVPAVTYNVLSTPRAGQYQLALPDGTHVWMNNASSLRYPTSFQANSRVVELTGEAYFEVEKNDYKPFIVKVKDQEVLVLGTAFNIMAYPDEGGTQATLLSGAVQVKSGNKSVKLKPDEQSRVQANGQLSVIKDVPSQEIVSWKNGFFYFDRASLTTVMRQLARWYDVEVVYEGEIPDIEFGGKIDRSLPLNDLLKFLDRNQIHFRLEGRKLIVLAN